MKRKKQKESLASWLGIFGIMGVTMIILFVPVYVADVYYPEATAPIQIMGLIILVLWLLLVITIVK